MVKPSSQPLVLMLVDGLGYEFVTSETTPNLRNLADDCPFYPMRPVLGYSDCQRAALFTGLPPDQMGYWMQYRFARPSDSPWRQFSKLAMWDSLPGELPRKFFKLALSSSVLKIATQRGPYPDLNVHNMPFRALPWHSPTLKKSMYAPGALGEVPTIFDRLRETKQSFGIVRSDTVGKLALLGSVTSQMRRLLGEIDALDGSVRFMYIYLHSPDMFAHRRGIRDPRFWEELKKTDSAIVEIIDAAKRKMGTDTQVVLTSDHGMNHTERFISYKHLVTHSGFGRDFVVGLDSTMVRLWYLSDDGKKIARPLVESSDVGRFLTGEERIELGVDFPGDHYGDDIYLLEPGVSIYPNFHSLLKPLGMHAYHPQEPDQRAIAMLIGDAIAERAPDKPELHMTDISPLMCATLGLDGV